MPRRTESRTRLRLVDDPFTLDLLDTEHEAVGFLGFLAHQLCREVLLLYHTGIWAIIP